MAHELGEKIYDVVRGTAMCENATSTDVRRVSDKLADIIKAAAVYVSDDDAVASDLTEDLDGWETILFLGIVDEMKRIKSR